jgi:hypothetical protein
VKTHGDIPEDHRTILYELEILELWFNENKSDIIPEMAAKGMTCMASDYYSIFMDEEGERLLLKAEKLNPGYFRGAIRKHLIDDPDFYYLMSLIKSTGGLDVLRSFGFNE